MDLPFYCLHLYLIKTYTIYRLDNEKSFYSLVEFCLLHVSIFLDCFLTNSLANIVYCLCLTKIMIYLSNRWYPLWSYHIAGSMGVFYAREPYSNIDAMHATRFLGLAPVGNKAKQVWLLSWENFNNCQLFLLLSYLILMFGNFSWLFIMAPNIFKCYFVSFVIYLAFTSELKILTGCQVWMRR